MTTHHTKLDQLLGPDLLALLDELERVRGAIEDLVDDGSVSALNRRTELEGRREDLCAEVVDELTAARQRAAHESAA